MKRSSRTLTIISVILAVAALALVIFMPVIIGGTTAYANLTGNILKGEPLGILDAIKTGIVGQFQSLINFNTASFNSNYGEPVGVLVMNILILVMMGLLAISWIVHLVMLIVKRRPGVIAKDILWLVFGASSLLLVWGAVGKDFFFDGQIVADSGTTYYHDVFGFIADASTLNVGIRIVIILAFALAFIAFVLQFIGIIMSICDVCRNPGLKKVKAEKKTIEATEVPDEEKAEETDKKKEDKKADDEDLKELQNQELDVTPDGAAPVVVSNAQTEQAGRKDAPLIVQYINYNGEPRQAPATVAPAPVAAPAPAPIAAPAPAPRQPQPTVIYVKEPKQEERKPVEEKKSVEEPKPTPVVVVSAPAPIAAPAPVKEEKDENRPVTAKELRAIIKDALDGHEHPEDDQPLSDASARQLIRDELAAYYAPTPAEEPAPVEEPEPEEPEEPEANQEMLTSDELREIIREEISSSRAADEAQRKAEADKEAAAKAEADKKAAEEAQRAKDEADKKAIADRQASIEANMLKADDVRNIVKEEFAAAPKAEGVKSDDVRVIVKEELEASGKKAAEGEEAAKDREMRQASKEARQDNEIASIKGSILSAEEIRTIISQELDRKLAAAPKKEEPKLVEEPKPAPEAQPQPATVVLHVTTAPAPEPVKVEEPKPVAPAPKPVAPTVAVPKEKIVRVPFPERFEGADKEMKNNYNELKAEAISYGLKSRISNSGDTFRLHTKSYLKITVAGKGLKLYFALDPKDYVNSPIPVKDAGGKNIYKDIPVCFKVKSPLSLKRAKQLIADACEKDNLEQGKIDARNFAAELKNYKSQGNDDDADDDDDNDDK